MFIKLINITLCNSATGGGEQDEMKYLIENGKFCVISHENMLEKIVRNLSFNNRFINVYRGGELKCYPVPTKKDDINYILNY